MSWARAAIRHLQAAHAVLRRVCTGSAGGLRRRQQRWCQRRFMPLTPARDLDDQKFIDLAVGHGAILVSKDKAVLCMRKRLLTLDVQGDNSYCFEGASSCIPLICERLHKRVGMPRHP